MKYFPKVVGSKVYLSPIDPDDAPVYAAWLNDLDTAKYLTIASVQVNLPGERAALGRLADEHNYAIVERGTDRLLGNCGLVDHSAVHRRAEVGIFIGDAAARGKGYGTEALGLLCDYAFNVLNLHSLSLRVFAFNGRAAASYRKLGFRDCGRLREAHFYGGEYHDIVQMDLLSRDFSSFAVPPVDR